MTTTTEAPLHKLEVGQVLWMLREDTHKLAEIAYYYSVEDYDGEYCLVEIHGHADGDSP